MENKKHPIVIIIFILLAISIIVMLYFYNKFNTEQLTLLSGEANKILEADLTQYNIDFKIRTKKDYAKVEKAIKEYISSLKNIYTEMNEISSGINPNLIFSVQNMKKTNLEDVDNIISEYKEKSQTLVTEYEKLVTTEKIEENINSVNISIRKKYYTNLYNEIMLKDGMKSQYEHLEEKIKDEKGIILDKLNKIQKIKEFFNNNKNYWTIKDDKIQFTNLNKMTEYYNLVNSIID